MPKAAARLQKVAAHLLIQQQIHIALIVHGKLQYLTFHSSFAILFEFVNYYQVLS